MKTHTAAAAIADGLEVYQINDKYLSDPNFRETASDRTFLQMQSMHNQAMLNLLINLTALIEDLVSDNDQNSAIISRLDTINASLSEISRKQKL
jgi:hypothetical protein